MAFETAIMQEDVDRLADALLSANPSDNDYKSQVRQLRRQCRSSGLVPTSCRITQAIERSSSEPVSRSFMSDIYRGILNGVDVAIKVLRLHMNDVEETQKMFIHELLLWRYLRHPNIVPFMGSCDTFGVCLVSQWMEGGTIDVYLRDHPEGDRTRYVKDVVRGLAFMHSLDIVHGDLKAANVLVDIAGYARLTDFGLALLTNATVAASGLAYGGTIRWMAPELLQPEEDDCEVNQGNEGNPTKESDLYSLAMTAWEIYTGKIPFSHLRKDVTVIIKVLAGVRPPRPMDCTSRGLDDAMWTRLVCWWDPSPSARPAMWKTWGPAMVVAHEDSDSDEESDHAASLPRPPRRMALLVGMTMEDVDPDNPSFSHGVQRAKDVAAIRELLIDIYQFRDQEITVMLHSGTVKMRLRPTKTNIIKQLERMARGARAGDSYFLFHSGYATWEEYASGSESDRSEPSRSGVENTGLYNILVRSLPAGARLFALFDACQAGPMLKLPHTKCTAVASIGLAALAVHRLMHSLIFTDRTVSYGNEQMIERPFDISVSTDGMPFIASGGTQSGPSALASSSSPIHGPAKCDGLCELSAGTDSPFVVSLAAAADDELCFETGLEGLMTKVFVDIIRGRGTGAALSYEELIIKSCTLFANIYRERLRIVASYRGLPDFDLDWESMQRPQLSSLHPLASSSPDDLPHPHLRIQDLQQPLQI